MFGGNKPKPDRAEIPKVIDGRYFIEKASQTSQKRISLYGFLAFK